MRYETVLKKYTDIISDNQYITTWYFDSPLLNTVMKYGDYSHAVRQSILRVFKTMAMSGNKRIKYRGFTLFMGDCGESFQYLCAGIRNSTYRAVRDLFYNEFQKIPGYVHETSDRMPFTPLVPLYRYINGEVIEYTYDISRAGKKYIDTVYDTGLTIHYRLWLSAEAEGLKERYIEEVYSTR